MKVLFLPLDSRPVTYELPYLLGQAAGFTVIRPDRSIMDYYKQPSRYEQIKDWLLASVRGCTRAIISVEQLVYGGLLASREMDIDLKEATDRLKIIETLKQIEPGINIVLTNTLMRSTISTLSSDDVIWWQKVIEYSRYYTIDQKKAEELAKQIPAFIIERFMGVRQRNHQINLQCIGLLNERYIDKLVILQEDSTPEGIHKAEQQILLDKITALSINDRFQLMNGTDEIASTLMGSIASKVSQVYLDWYHAEHGDFTCRFEDRPFSENVTRYLQLAGISETSLPASDHVIAVYYPEDLKQGDYCGDEIAVNSAAGIQRYVEHLQELIDQGKKVYLLDIYNGNGGSPDLLKMIIKAGILNKLWGYSGWNTGSNSLGTLIGEMAVDKKCQQLFDYHLLDDVLYQAVIRERLNRELEQQGEDVWDLTNKDEVSVRLNKMMHDKQKEFGLRIEQNYEVSLNWPRTFECQIDFKEED